MKLFWKFSLTRNYLLCIKCIETPVIANCVKTSQITHVWANNIFIKLHYMNIEHIRVL